MTKDTGYFNQYVDKDYQSICKHDFELENIFRMGESGNMTYETCTICKLNISRFPKN